MVQQATKDWPFENRLRNTLREATHHDKWAVTHLTSTTIVVETTHEDSETPQYRIRLMQADTRSRKQYRVAVDDRDHLVDSDGATAPDGMPTRFHMTVADAGNEPFALTAWFMDAVFDCIEQIGWSPEGRPPCGTWTDSEWREEALPMFALAGG